MTAKRTIVADERGDEPLTGIFVLCMFVLFSSFLAGAFAVDRWSGKVDIKTVQVRTGTVTAISPVLIKPPTLQIAFADNSVWFVVDEARIIDSYEGLRDFALYENYCFLYRSDYDSVDYLLRCWRLP